MSKMTVEECREIWRKHSKSVPHPGRTWGDTQKLTREQVGMLAYFAATLYTRDLLEALNRVGAIAETKEAKPTFLPIKRHVRWRDLEDGCVLRYCGNESRDYSCHEGDGLLVLGELYTVKRDECGITIPYSKTSRHGVHEGYWGWGPSVGMECWEFVSNPNFVHGLDKRKTYFLKDQDKYDGTLKGPIKVLYEYPMTYTPFENSQSPTNRYAMTDRGCWVPVEDLTTEEPKPAEPTYKVYDGEVKASDKVWWWGNTGPEQRVASENLRNLSHFPNVYSIAEPPFTMTKLTNGQTIKTYDYMQAPYGDYKKYQAAHPLNKVCDEVKSPADIPPSEWCKGDVLRVVDGYYKGHCIPTGAEVTITDASEGYVHVPRPAGYGGSVGGWNKSRFEFVRRPS